jgi:endonuclease YncB( thermonuclease family)
MQGQYWTMLALGAVSAVLLLLGLTNLVVATMPWAHTGLHVRVSGVYPYDRESGRVSGSPRRKFPQGRTFAARVNWSSLPSGLNVGAAWYDDNETQVAAITPAAAGDLAARHATVPMTDTNAPPGAYTVLVMHYVDGRPIEILGRTTVRITRR